MNQYSNKDKIDVGFFPDFVVSSVLFSGESAALRIFAKILRETIASTSKKVKFSDNPLFNCRNIEIILIKAENPHGMKKSGEGRFDWILSDKELLRFSNDLENLAQTPRNEIGGHYYLDADSLDDVQVIASTGEYPSDFFEEV